MGFFFIPYPGIFIPLCYNLYNNSNKTDAKKNDDKLVDAVLPENLASDFHHTNFYAHEINKAEEDVWLVYPWEAVGKYEA